MIFNPYLTKQGQEVIFCIKTRKLLYPSLSFNNISLKNSVFQKHLWLKLGVKLNFVEHMKNITQKINKTIDLLRRFPTNLPRLSLLTIYKTFLKSQLDNADFIYDQGYNFSFKEKLESLQDNACLEITEAISGTSSKKLFQELGLDIKNN